MNKQDVAKLKQQEKTLEIINHILETKDNELTMADYGYKAAIRDILSLIKD